MNGTRGGTMLFRLPSNPKTNKGNSAGIAMKSIILKELTLSEWKGQNRHVVFGENENKVYGANASGKTSLMRAWNWLLTGYSDCNSPMNADLFNNKEEVTKDTPIASVKAVVSIDNEIYTIERSAEAKFQRKRGSESFEKASSDSYVYKVDEIERSANDFRDWLSEKFTDVDMLRFAIDGSYFVASVFDDKKKSRQIIERLVGSVTREEMRGNYECIDELLKKFTLDEIDARAQNLIKGIDQRLNEIPALIRQKEDEISEIEQTDFAAVDKGIAELEKQRNDLDKQMTDLTERIRPQMEAKHEAERAKQMKEDVFDKAYQEWRKSFDVRRQKLTEEINAIKRQNAKSNNEQCEEITKRRKLKETIEEEKKHLEIAKQKRARLIEERDKEKSVTMNESSTLCPHCGAQLQGDKLQEVVDRFERVKRERIDAIVAEGKKTAIDIEQLEKSIKDLQEYLAQPLPQVISQPTEDLEKQLLEVANTDISKVAFMETEQGKALLDDIGSVVIPEVVMTDNTEIVNAKNEVNNRLVPLYERRGLKFRLTTLRNALDELRIEQKEKGSEMADYERQRKAVKDFRQEQMEILSRKVNDGLKCSKISVWSQQKDGNMVPDLVLKDENGVNFATSNGANRIRVTADIQRFFCDRLGVNMPLWIDEVSVLESRNIPHYEGVQTFLLFCSETSLKIESK